MEVVFCSLRRAGMLLLPGGGAEGRESRFEAAIREMREETGLIATHAFVLFEHESRTNMHKVVWASATGTPTPQDDAVALHYCTPDNLASLTNISHATRRIIQRYWEYKEQHVDLFRALANHAAA